MHRPGVEHAISRSRVRRPNHYTTEPPIDNDDDDDDKSSYLGHDVLVVVIPQRAAELVIVHVRFAFSFTPASSHLVRVSQFELTGRSVPRYTRRVARVRQQLQQELPQLDLTAP